MPRTISPRKSEFAQFKKVIWAYYATHRRSFPWRERAKNMRDSEWVYRVVISEIMLQQTQAPRVVEKFNSFMKKFPDFPALAAAPLASVLAEWQGLGYNRRGLYLKKLAKTVTQKYAGKMPHTRDELVELPGIGPHTAGSILAFAFNIPEPFIETNIRTVFIHFFFKKYSAARKISDSEILPLVAETLDHKNPRDWFFALMDYGVHLKQLARVAQSSNIGVGDPARRSKHYKKQSAFKGSNRELRAALLRSIIKKPRGISYFKNAHPPKSVQKVDTFTGVTEKEIRLPPSDYKNTLKNLTALEREGFIQKKNGVYSIAQ